MKTAISLPDHLFERAESVAERLGISRSELYATALEAFLEDHDTAAQRRALDALYTSESSNLPLGAQRAQVRIVSEWDE
jgi:metal-responsive CopG/Arc/MetJ family transcriptional regulator